MSVIRLEKFFQGGGYDYGDCSDDGLGLGEASSSAAAIREVVETLDFIKDRNDNAWVERAAIAKGYTSAANYTSTSTFWIGIGDSARCGAGTLPTIIKSDTEVS